MSNGLAALAPNRKPQAFVGIDIGLDGAIAAVIEGQPMPSLFEMPTRTIQARTAKQKNRRVLDSARTLGIFRLLVEQFELYVTIERPQLRPAMAPSGHKCPACGRDHLFVNQGLSSQAAFIGQFERIAGQLEALQIPFEDVHPATWKADVFHGRSEKTDARMLAGQLYPVIADKMTLKKNDGLAEALLLADYGKRHREAPF